MLCWGFLPCVAVSCEHPHSAWILVTQVALSWGTKKTWQLETVLCVRCPCGVSCYRNILDSGGKTATIRSYLWKWWNICFRLQANYVPMETLGSGRNDPNLEGNGSGDKRTGSLFQTRPKVKIRNLTLHGLKKKIGWRHPWKSPILSIFVAVPIILRKGCGVPHSFALFLLKTVKKIYNHCDICWRSGATGNGRWTATTGIISWRKWRKLQLQRELIWPWVRQCPQVDIGRRAGVPRIQDFVKGAGAPIEHLKVSPWKTAKTPCCAWDRPGIMNRLWILVMSTLTAYLPCTQP